MRLHDGTILMHGRTPYDPIKAHEYYMRTRQLKGRKKGSPTFLVTRPGAKTVVLSQKELVEQRAYAAKRIQNIKNKLSELSSKLREALREAEEKKAKTQRKADKSPTAAENSKAAREAKKYRDRHKQSLATKRKRVATKTKTSSDNDPVADLQSKIGEIKKRLSAAVAIQRALAGATRNR